MKLFAKRYFYYVVYEAWQDAQVLDRSAVELELRTPVTSIAHCEALSEYIRERIEAEPKNRRASKKASRKKRTRASKKEAELRVVILSFTLLRTERRFFAK